MVKEGFGIDGKDSSIGSNLLLDTALSDRFSNANGRYFDNDIQAFSEPNSLAMDIELQVSLLRELNEMANKV